MDITDTDVIPVDGGGLRPRDKAEVTLGFGASYIGGRGSGQVELYAKHAKVDESQNLLNTDFGRRDSSENLTASIGYQTDNYSIVAFGRNLTDDQVEVGIPIGDLFAAGIINQGRTFGLEFTYEM